jgi:hypothetical protein
MKGIRIICTAFVLYALLLVTACPVSPKTVTEVKDASGKLAKYANAGVDVTRELYHQKIISIGVKDTIADGFSSLADAGIAFDAAVANLEATFGSNVPRSEMEKLFALFDSTVVEKFLAVVKIKLPDQFSSAFELLKSAILVIANAFHQKKAISTKIAAAVA